MGLIVQYTWKEVGRCILGEGGGGGGGGTIVPVLTLLNLDRAFESNLHRALCGSIQKCYAMLYRLLQACNINGMDIIKVAGRWMCSGKATYFGWN